MGLQFHLRLSQKGAAKSTFSNIFFCQILPHELVLKSMSDEDDESQ